MPKKRFTTTATSPHRTTHHSLSPSSAIPSTFTDALPLPALLVFDLDYTLWPFWVDTHVSGPLKPASTSPPNTSMLDRWGESYTFYPGVPAILHAARQRNITMSLASRTHAPDLAREMLKGLHVTPGTQLTTPTPAEEDSLPSASASTSVLSKIRSSSSASASSKQDKHLRAIDYFTHAQIFPGSKVSHFKKIQDGTRRAGLEVAFADMLFFDDEARNRDVERELGVTFHLVPGGVSREEVDRGVWAWRKRRGIRGGRQEGGEIAELEA